MNGTFDKDRIDAITARHTSATPGPWPISESGKAVHVPYLPNVDALAYVGNGDNAAFASHAWDDIDWLLNLVRARQGGTPATAATPTIPGTWPTAEMVAAEGTVWFRDEWGDYLDKDGVIRGEGRQTFHETPVPVMLATADTLTMLWSALEQWLNGTLATTAADMNRLVGVVVALRETVEQLNPAGGPVTGQTAEKGE